jgi:hypothetical protein
MSRILICFLLLTSTARAQAAHTFLVFGENCKAAPGRRTLSGFRVLDPTPKVKNAIVTALHGVAGCDITAASDGSIKLTKPLKLTAVDVASDLALLTSAELSALAPAGMRFRPSVEWNRLAGQNLVAWGHPQNVTLKDEKVTVHNTPLEELRTYFVGIPKDQRDKLANRHSPEATLQVVSLFGPLQAGDSGAPVLDSEGFVVAVADGGLDGGFGNVVWAVPVNSKIPWDEAEQNSELRRVESLSLVGLFSSSGSGIGNVKPDSIESIKQVIDAARRGDRTAVESIVESGALDAVGLQNALGAASNANREDLVRYLLEKGAIPEPFDYQFAAADGHITILKLLLKFDSSHIPPSMLYATTDAVLNRGLQLDVLRFVGTIEGIQPNYKAPSAGTSLSMAARAGRADVVEVLLKVPGMNPNAPGYLGDNPIDEACSSQHSDVVRQLSRAGGRPSARSIKCYRNATGHD